MKKIKWIVIIIIIGFFSGMIKVNNAYNVETKRMVKSMQEDNIPRCDFYTEFLYSKKEKKKIKLFLSIYPFDFRLCGEKNELYINSEAFGQIGNKVKDLVDKKLGL